MFYLPNPALIASILFLNGTVFGFVAPSPQTLFRRFPTAPTATLLGHNTTQASSFANSCRPSSSSHGSITTAAPSSTYRDVHAIPELSEQCILWNSSCCGDRKAIAAEFFNNTRPFMEEKKCWKVMDYPSNSCDQIESPDILSAMRAVKSWMRTPDCASVRADPDSSEGCCGSGYIRAANVDVYYWPEPDPNTACLSVVGDTIHPLDYGATTATGVTYWGCPPAIPKTSTMKSEITDSSGRLVSTITTMTVQSILTTAQISVIGSITFKQSLFNPWSPAPCIEETSTLSPASVPAGNHTSHAPIRARAHSLLISSSVTQADGLPVSTVVSGSFTFTSPSIYANFHSVAANDWCGQLGSEQVVTQTMLTFTPGELSTIAGPLTRTFEPQFPYRAFSTKRFNFADLPCPPQSVMEENWYKPQPGEPYRPLLALPSQLTSIDPSYTYCIPVFFTAVDPPRPLAPATAMVSEVTASQTISALSALTGNAPLPGGATKTAVQDWPISTPGITSSESQPSKTSVPASNPQTQGSDHQSKYTLGQQIIDPSILGSNLDRQTSSVRGADPASILADVKQTSQVLSVQDPERSTAHQMSHIESGQVLSPQSSTTAIQEGGYADIQSTRPMRSQQTYETPQPVTSAERQHSSFIETSLLSNAPSLPEVHVSMADNSITVDASGVSGEASKDAVDGILTPAPSLPEVHVSMADNSITVDASGVSGEASKGAVDGILTPAPQAISTGQRISIEGGHWIVPFLGPETTPAASINGHAVEVVSEGVLVHGSTSPTALIAISGAAVSLDPSHNVYLGGTPYQLPTSSPVPTATLADGAVDVPLMTGVLDHGTTSTAGASATKTALQMDPTLSRGTPAVTVNGVPVTPTSAGGLMVGSETMASTGPYDSLGHLIAGGLQTGGPTANSASTSLQGSSTPGLDSNSSNGHTIQSIGEGAQSGLSWKAILTTVATITALLHI